MASDQLTARAEKIAEDLVDRRSTPRKLQDELDNDDELAKAVDERVFQCTGCGWWCARADEAEEEVKDSPVCQECVDDGKAS